jgi:GDP-L-fucose synthase
MLHQRLARRRRLEVAWDAGRPDGMPRKLPDVSRLNRLGWQPTIGLDAGIRSMYRWYRSRHQP